MYNNNNTKEYIFNIKWSAFTLLIFFKITSLDLYFSKIVIIKKIFLVYLNINSFMIILLKNKKIEIN